MALRNFFAVVDCIKFEVLYYLAMPSFCVGLLSSCPHLLRDIISLSDQQILLYGKLSSFSAGLLLNYGLGGGHGHYATFTGGGSVLLPLRFEIWLHFLERCCCFNTFSSCRSNTEPL